MLLTLVEYQRELMIRGKISLKLRVKRLSASATDNVAEFENKVSAELNDFTYG